MKKWIGRAKKLGEQVAQARTVVASAPEKMAELRAAVQETAQQIRQAGGELHGLVGDLKLDGVERISSFVAELWQGEDVLNQAGCEVADVSIDVVPTPRLLLELEVVERVSRQELERLAASLPPNGVLRGVLGALLTAEPMWDVMPLQGLEARRLLVQLGASPAVRLAWGRVATVEDGSESRDRSALGDGPAATPGFRPADPASEPFGPSVPMAGSQPSQFAAREPEMPRTSAQAAGPVVPKVQLPGPEEDDDDTAIEAEVRAAAAGGGALDRFKKMPDLTSRRRETRWRR